MQIEEAILLAKQFVDGHGVKYERISKAEWKDSLPSADGSFWIVIFKFEESDDCVTDPSCLPVFIDVLGSRIRAGMREWEPLS